MAILWRSFAAIVHFRLILTAVTAVTLTVVCLSGLVREISCQEQTGIHKRFEYKLSFKGPFLVQKDGTIPFWEHFGHAIASDESVRITPSLKSKKGSVWSKEANSHENWEIEVVFRINGRGRIGADGLAIWYTEARGVEGPVFGSTDAWKGLGIFLDSFDNDGLKNNPYIMAMVNDGTLAYDHEADGSSQQMGGCLRDFRNKPYPVRIKVEYYKKALTILFNTGLTNMPDDYEMCMRVEGVELSPNGYFGISAATGALADDHDVFSFLTHSLLPPTNLESGGSLDNIPDEDRRKFEREFEDYRDKLEKARDEYKKDHPTKPGEYVDGDEDKMYEQQETRELRMIFDGQNEIHRLVRSLLVKLDEVVGRQERGLSMLTLINQGGNAGQPQGGGQGQLPPSSSIQRHEVDALLNSQRDLVNTVYDVKTLVNDVNLRFTRLGQDGTGPNENANSELVQHLQEIKGSFGNVQNDMRALLATAQASAAVSCPPASEVSCATPFLLFTFLLVQLFCIIGYFMYRNSREAAAKKFY